MLSYPACASPAETGSEPSAWCCLHCWGWGCCRPRPGTRHISNTTTSTTIITWNCSSDSWILPSCLRIKPEGEGEQMNAIHALTMSLSTIYPARSWRIHTSSEIPVAASWWWLYISDIFIKHKNKGVDFEASPQILFWHNEGELTSSFSLVRGALGLKQKSVAEWSSNNISTFLGSLLLCSERCTGRGLDIASLTIGDTLPWLTWVHFYHFVL